MCRSAQRRGSVHRAHPRNHGDAEHPAEQDGGGKLPKTPGIETPPPAAGPDPARCPFSQTRKNLS
ncbi:unnamed protein product [Gadus morhua 'NCC']